MRTAVILRGIIITITYYVIMDEEKYVLECFSKSYTNWGEGIDKEVYKRAFLDGYKTAMAMAFAMADKIIDDKMQFR